jgi:hypothetical protein
MKRFSVLLTTVILVGAASLSFAQEKRASPHESVTATIGGKKITISYGRPYVKGRNVWAAPLAPYGQVWRTGADEATKLTTEADLMIGTLKVPAGSYSLFTIPGETEWTLIVNKTAVQWGAYDYKENMDLGRVKMKVTKLASPVEQLTISITPDGGSKGTLKIAWASVEASVPISVQ